MNKIFKVVWSKTKECYVVVSEVAKNNGGKKKVLASVLAGLAMVGAAAQMGTPVQAGANNGGNAVNLWADKKLDGSNNSANTVGANSVAVGNNLVAGDPTGATNGRTGGTAIAIGVESKAKDDRNIAIGYNNTTEGQDSFAMGSNVIAGTGQSIAIGSTNVDATTGVATQTIARGKVTMKNGRPEPAAAIAIGAGAQALDGSGVLAMGQLAKAVGNNDVAIGTQTKVIGNNSTAIGSTAQAIGNSSAAYGTQAVANGLGATAVGPGASAGTGDTAATAAAGATAVGRASQATKEGASALGWAANASVENAAAIGRDTTANIAGGVALGYQSVTTTAAGVQGYNPADSRINKYSTQSGAVGTSTLAAVSVGNGTTATRQITGLAAGTADTDAVNVAQLKNVNLKYAADTGNSDVLLKDGTLTVKGDGDLISTAVQTNGAIKVTAKKGGTITNTDGKAVKPTTNGIATTDNVADAINNSYWKATAGGNTDGTPTVGNVKPGTQVTYSAGDNLKVKQTIAANGDQEYKYSLNPVLTGITSISNATTGPKMTFGGSSINITGGNLSLGDGTTNNKIVNVAPGTDDNDAVNVKQLKDTELHITPGTYTPDANKKVKLTYTNGNNTVVNGKEAVIDLSSLTTGGTTSTEKVQKAADATNDKNIAEVGPKSGDTFGAANATYEVSVSRNAVKDAAREAVTVNNGGTTTGGTYTADTNNPISVTPTPDNTNHNTTYAITFDGNKAAKQIPLTYKANGTGDKTVKLDKGLDFTNGTNTTAEIGNDGVVKFNLNKDVDLTNAGSLTVGGTKVNNGGVTITAPAGGTTTDVKLTNTGLDNGGNKIVNVADGDVNATSKDAINGSQLYTVDQKFNNKINLGADGNTETTKLALDNASGIKFNIKGDGSGASGANQYISTTASGSDIKVDLTQDAKDKLNKTYNVTSTNHSVAINTTTANGVTTFDLQVAPATGTTSTWDIKSSADTANGGATATGHETNAKTIANTNSVEMIAGKNLTVKQTSDTNGAKVEFALSDEIAVGKDGANGIDGKIGVNGKDGASVVINGKDGSIGLTGVPGTPGTPGASATLKVKDGVPGVDGAPGTNLTRIVYTDKNNVDHEVATHDDGMKFAGDDGQANQATNANVIKKHLNSVVDIIGGATKADLTTNNIGVNNDGNKLLVQLSKNLNGINTIKNGGTTITLNDAPGGATNIPAVTISGGNLSMGDGTHNNKIVNVAPGTDDNDAVNYKQLKAAKTEVKAGDNVTVKLTTDTTDGHNVYTVSAVTPAVYTKADGTKVYKIVDPTTGAVTWNTSPDGTGTVVNAGDVITSFESPANGTTPGSTTDGNMIVNNVGSAINGQTGTTYLDKLNAAAGDNNTKHAAVNVTDLKSTADALKSNELHIRPTTSGRTGETVNQGAGGTAESYKYDAATKSVTLKYNDGTGAGITGTEAKIDLSGLANQITSGYTFKANATANGGTVANDATTPAVATTVENGGTINYAAGKNLTVKQDIDATNKTQTYTYSLDKDVNVETVTVTGQNGKDGKIGLNGKDGTNGVNGTNRVDIQVEKGVDGIDGKNGTDGISRIVYEDKTGKHTVATMDDGLKFTGNNESTENKHKLGSLVKVQGEGVTENTTTNKLEANGEEFKSASGNIAVVADSIDKLTVKLNKNLAGINKISNGNSSITLNDTPSATTPAVTISGGNLSMGDGTHNNKIVNVAPGTDDNDAVNYKQLKAAKTEVKAGDNVTVKLTTDTTDGHNVYTVSAVTPAVYTKADGTKVYKIVDPTTGAVTWNTSPDGTGTVVNAGDVITSFESPANGTTPGSTTGGNMIVNNVGSAIKNLGNTGDNYLTKLDLANNATPNAAVNVSDLKNTADALKANERHIAPTTVATGSTETKGGTVNAAGTANVYKYDAASKTVTLTYNDGNGNAVTDTKAVIDLSNLSTGGTGASSWNIASDKVSATEGAVATGSAGTQNIADGKTVTMKAGKNLTVNQTNDGAGNASVAFSLDKNLENLDKVVVNGNDGATGQAGVSIVGPKGANGVDGNDGKVGIAGKDGKDAVSISGKDGVGHIGLQGPKGAPGTPGADGANLDITTDHGTQTLVKPEANNDNKSERIVYVPKDANGNPLKDTDGNTIKREVATMDDGLKFTGNNTGTVNKHKLGSLVKVQGEGVSATDEAAFVSASGNIAVTAENNDTLTIRLNKNLKGLNSIQLGGNTIQSNGDNITFTTNGGTTKTVATTDQLWTIQADGTDVPAKAGKVNLVAGDHITITPDAANGKMTISATGFGSMDGFNVKSSASTGGTHAGDTTENIKNGKTVDMQAGKNLTVTQTNDGNGNTTVNYALNKDVDLGTTGSLKIGDTTINNGGLTIANGPSITSTGVDAGDKKITNVSDGAVTATSKDAVNGSQLKKYTDAAKTTVEAGDDNVKVETDNSAADGHTNYKVSLKPVVEIGDTHKVKIDGHTGDITGLTNVTLNDPTFATKGRAATEEQLKQVLTEAKNKAIEKVQAGTAAAGDTNIATVLPKAGDTFGAAGATYEVSVSKNAVKDAAKEAVKVTSVSPAITVTPDTSVAHETTYKVGFDGNQAATQIPLTYKQNGGSARTVKLSDGLNFIDGTNTKARTAADGKVTFDVMGDLTGITSISNASGGPKMTFGGSSINVTGGNLSMGDGTHNNKIVNVAPGTDGTDAVNLNQLNGVRTKVSPGRNVTVDEHPLAGGGIEYVVNAEPAGTVDLTNVNNRVDQLGEEIGRVGAQGAALSALKPIQYDPLEPTQIMAGYGNYRGTSAIAMGVAHYKNESTLIHGGISWAGGSSHMMANAGVTWKVGNRDSEAAVADRYRKGPISSAYAMQQEMAAMKAQNAGLKGEVSDLKAENEQMKAQIAAMMAKLGL